MVDIDRVVIATKHCAPNDRNGNPRRVWVFRSVHNINADVARRNGVNGYSHIAFTHDEGYGSLRDAIEAYRPVQEERELVIDNGSVNCSPAEYKAFVRWGK